MALNTRLSGLALVSQLNTLSILADGGFLNIYTSTQPSSPDIDITTEVLLASFNLPDPAFEDAIIDGDGNGLMLAYPIPSTEAVEIGTASWFRIFQSDGTTSLWDGSVGTIDANLIVNSVDFQKYATVEINSLAHKFLMQGS
jgi:hypothetical protein